MANGPMFYELAAKLCKWSVCSKCFSGLEKREDPDNLGGWLVSCSKDATHVGTVSMRTAEQRLAESESDARRVIKMLRENGYLPDPLAGKSKEDLKRELGFQE